MNGVTGYIKGTVKETVWFPNGEIFCVHCKYHKSKTTNGHTHVICIKTYEPLYNPLYDIGEDCILTFEEEFDESDVSSTESG